MPLTCRMACGASSCISTGGSRRQNPRAYCCCGFFMASFLQKSCRSRFSRAAQWTQGWHRRGKESKSYVANPARVPTMYRSAPPEALPARAVLATEQFVIALQKTIFESCYVDCLPEAVLRQRYLDAAPRAIECDLLAHIVSCRRCLDAVIRLCNVSIPGMAKPLHPACLLSSAGSVNLPSASVSSHNVEQTLSKQAAFEARLCTESKSPHSPSTRSAQAVVSEVAQSVSTIETVVESNDAQQAHRKPSFAFGATTQER